MYDNICQPEHFILNVWYRTLARSWWARSNAMRAAWHTHMESPLMKPPTQSSTSDSCPRSNFLSVNAPLKKSCIFHRDCLLIDEVWQERFSERNCMIYIFARRERDRYASLYSLIILVYVVWSHLSLPLVTFSSVSLITIIIIHNLSSAAIHIYYYAYTNCIFNVTGVEDWTCSPRMPGWKQNTCDLSWRQACHEKGTYPLWKPLNHTLIFS